MEGHSHNDNSLLNNYQPTEAISEFQEDDETWDLVILFDNLF